MLSNTIIFVFSLWILCSIIMFFYADWLSHYSEMYKYGHGILCGDYKSAIKEFDNISNWKRDQSYRGFYGDSYFPLDENMGNKDQIHANIISINGINYRLGPIGYAMFCLHVRKNKGRFPVYFKEIKLSI